MVIHSRYLNRDIDVQESVSGNEDITIVPHDALEEIIFNSEDAIDNDIKVHYQTILTEPGHYAFLCAIDDKNGRRVEYIGESLPETLETDIARKYPALMAFKRSFDAAAIKFLGLPGKVYSDQQVSAANETRPIGRSFSAPPIEDDTPAAEKPAAKNDASDKSAAETAKKTSDGPKEPEDKKPAKRQSARKSVGYAAPPLDDGEPNKPKETSPEKRPMPKYAAPPVEEAIEQDEDSGGDESQDEFDSIIITCGKLKNYNLSIRQTYERGPSSVHWIAEEMEPRNDSQRVQKEACIRFLKTVEGSNEED